jgi:hypothetical protein
LPAWVWPVVDLWLLTRRYRGPFGGRIMPCVGGPADQPAALIDAFDMLDGYADGDKG